MEPVCIQQSVLQVQWFLTIDSFIQIKLCDPIGIIQNFTDFLVVPETLSVLSRRLVDRYRNAVIRVPVPHFFRVRVKLSF